MPTKLVVSDVCSRNIPVNTIYHQFCFYFLLQSVHLRITSPAMIVHMNFHLWFNISAPRPRSCSALTFVTRRLLCSDKRITAPQLGTAGSKLHRHSSSLKFAACGRKNLTWPPPQPPLWHTHRLTVALCCSVICRRCDQAFHWWAFSQSPALRDNFVK